MELNPTVARQWILQDNEKPWTVNAERTWHYHKRAKLVRECRERFVWLALEAKIGKLDRIKVAAIPLAKDRRGIQDVAACLPAVKAAVDGLVDAQVIVDDDPTHLVSLAFYGTQVTGNGGLRLVITEVL
jgi:hypothetical protein